jgi:3-hydroxybutyryl-CoA dehydrogenase
VAKKNGKTDRMNEKSENSPSELPAGGRTIAVLGAGTMGHGIAQVFALAGYAVNLYDSHEPTLDAATGRIARSLGTFISRGMVSSEQSRACLSRVHLCTRVALACKDAGLVCEAVPEDADLKGDLFLRVEEIVSDRAIICTNTSALSISMLSQRLSRPGRFLGVHFWNPAQVIPCVEVIKGDRTDPEIFDQVVDLLRAVGKEPVRVKKDVPGFLGNRLQHALQREALYLVEAGIADPEDVDKVVKHGFGLRYAFMGPLERADLGGLDITYAVQRYLLKELDGRTDASPLLAERVKRGDLGLKTGRGFYEWSREKADAVSRRRDVALLGIIQLLKDLEDSPSDASPRS